METSSRAKKTCAILDGSGGYEFEKAVAEAFSFLDFEAHVVEETQAESDVIVKAPLARNPYFVVVECGAVREGSQVSYAKVGQIRGNYVKYAGDKEFVDYETTYLAIIGKPSFSPDAIETSEGGVTSLGVTLLTAESLKSLVNLHDIYCFTQDELEEVFNPEGGPVADFSNLEKIGADHHKKIDLYAIIYVTLVGDIGLRMYRSDWTPRMHLVGSVRCLGAMLDIPVWTEEDVNRAIQVMTSPLVRVLEDNPTADSVRATSLPLDRIATNMGQKGKLFKKLVAIYHARLVSLASQSKLAEKMTG